MSLTEGQTGSTALSELRALWVSATADSVSGALDRAERLVENTPPHEREEAARYVAALWRLERWLHDR